MATSKVLFSYPSGETLVVRALPLTGSAYLLTSTSVSEAPANSGLYLATFTELAALSGAYRIIITLSGTGVASYQARWTGSDGETVAATELVDVSQVATAANLATVDTVVDSILVDTGTTIPAQITALNDFDPAADAVANVTLCATTTTNTDMRGTNSAATAASLATVDANVDSILVDTATTIPAQISALNNVAATDIVSAGAITTLAGAVANVDLVDVTTANTDMRGTDSANTTTPNTVVPDNTSVAAIKAKTDQLVFTVSNQVDSNALSGGGGGGLDAAGVRSAVGLSSANLDTQLTDIPTVSEFEARTIAAAAYFNPAADAVANVTLVGTTTTNTDMRGTDGANTTTPNTIAPDNASVAAILVDTGTTIPAQITALNNFDPASDAVANVTTVGTTTTNSDMRGTDSAATAANLATVDSNVDLILVDTGTTIPAQVTALNNFDPAADAVANVTLVATTTTNTDMRGTDGANTTTPNTVAPDNASIAAILVDTGTTVPAQITALNNFDPASDVVANVTAVGTTSVNSDMRGTDSAATAANLATVDSNVDSILVDTGTTIPAQITALNDFDPASDSVANVTLVATTTTNTDMRGTDGANTTTPNTVVPDNASVAAILVDTGTTIPAQITALNDFDPSSDTVANVTAVGTTTTNTDMRGTDNAATAANLATVDSVVDAVLVDTGTTIPAQITALNNIAATDIVSAGAITTLAGAVGNVDLVDVTTTNTDMRGTNGANTVVPVDVSSDVSAVKAKTDQLVFTKANEVDANAKTGSGGGGDATAANQAAIIAKLTTPAVVYTNPSSPNKLTIVRGDAYDDSTKNNGKLTWATGKTLAGASIRFTIRDANDVILIDQTTAGVTTAVNVQAAEVSLTTAATNLLTVATTNKFDAEAYWDADDRWTFARGQCTVLEDQTRT